MIRPRAKIKVERILAIGASAVVDPPGPFWRRFFNFVLGISVGPGTRSRGRLHDGHSAHAGASARIDRCAGATLAEAAVPRHAVVSINVLTPSDAFRPCRGGEARGRHQFVAVGLPDQIEMPKDLWL